MKISKRQFISWLIPLFLVSIINVFRYVPAWAEAYSRFFYPNLSAFLSAISSCVYFSLGDIFIVMAGLGLLLYPFYAYQKKKTIGYIVSSMMRFFLWVYIWFYVAWGMNYFRLSFYERTGIPKLQYISAEFQQFLSEYIDGLNGSYESVQKDSCCAWLMEPFQYSFRMQSAQVAEEITLGYRQLSLNDGVVRLNKVQPAKWMLWSKGMSRVGVSGYMGPFFSEYNLNRELLCVEYPFTYAHELAHRLGVAGEAEANFYATMVTTKALLPEIRYSGYFSILGYIMNNARNLLTEEEYREVLQQIHPEIIEMYREHLIYWRKKYNPSAGKIQHKVYNAYLKSNKISNGTKNYSEVVGLLMSVWQYKRVTMKGDVT